MTADPQVTLFGTVCVSAGRMDPHGVMGSGGGATVNTADVAAVGLLRVYGKSGYQKLVKTLSGVVVKVPVSKQGATARKWLDSMTAGMFGPTYSTMGGGFTAVTWKDIQQPRSAYWDTADFQHDVAAMDAE